MGKIEKFLASNDIKLYLSLFVLLVGAVVSVFTALNLYSNRVTYPKAQGLHKGAVIITDRGSIEIEFNEKAPIAISNFVRLSESGFYDGLRVHRVVPGVLLEIGDPLTRSVELKSKWGNGGAGYTFADEILPTDRMIKGVVAFVNNGPNTNSSQLFILAADAEWLNGKHTILGWVKKGYDTVERIVSAPVSVFEIPLEDITITKVVLK